MSTWDKVWILAEDSIEITEPVRCECGNDKMKVEWSDTKYTGGECRVQCLECNKTSTLIDDYA